MAVLAVVGVFAGMVLVTLLAVGGLLSSGRWQPHTHRGPRVWRFAWLAYWLSRR